MTYLFFEYALCIIFGSSNIAFAEVNSGIKSIKLTKKQESEYREKKGLPQASKHKISENQKVVASVELIREEEYVDNDGNIHNVSYYRPKFKYTYEAKNIQMQLNQKKLNASSNNLEPISIMGFNPEEGDFRVDVVRSNLTYKDNFDTVDKRYLHYLEHEAKYEFVDTGFYAISNPVVSYLSFHVLAYVKDQHKGSGSALSWERTVTKWGQIYTNGNWKDYYHGFQDEVYWHHVNHAYHKDTNKHLATGTEYYEPGYGYLPIAWKLTENFTNNNDIYSICLNGYTYDSYIYYDGNTEFNSRSNWKTKGSFTYY